MDLDEFQKFRVLFIYLFVFERCEYLLEHIKGHIKWIKSDSIDIMLKDFYFK